MNPRLRILLLLILAGLLLTARADDAPAPKPDAQGVYNVRDFGARGDDTGDDTAAIQAAIDAAIGPGDPAVVGRSARGTVYIPPGNYRITRPLRIWSVSFLTFAGAGYSSRLQPVGKLSSVLDINGAAFCNFRDFLIGGTTTEEVENAIYFYWDPQLAGRSTCGCEFRNITVRDTRCVTAFRIGKPGSPLQVDTSAYYNIMVDGRWTPGEETWWQYGFYVGSDVFANNIVHSFFNAGANRWRNGFGVSATTFMLSGGSLGSNEVDFYVGMGNYFLVQGMRSEDSQRLMVLGAGATRTTANISLTDIQWTSPRLAPDNQIIRAFQNGAIILRNVNINSQAPRACLYVNPFVACTLILDGVSSGNTLDGFLSGCTPSVDISVRGYTTEAPEGLKGVDVGLVMNRPIRWLGPGGGELRAESGALRWRGEELARKADLPAAQPPPKRNKGQATFARGQTTLTVEHGLGGQPAPEDVDVTLWSATRVWKAGVDEKTLTFRIERQNAPVTFTWSASLR